MIARVRLALAAVFLSTATTACIGAYAKSEALERMNPSVSPSQLKVLATIAGGRSRADLQVSATVRQILTDSGITVVRHSGRFESQQDAVRQVCDNTAGERRDGVLFVWYNRLELFDCNSQRAAYEISGGQQGITELTGRLLAYLRRDGPMTTSTP